MSEYQTVRLLGADPRLPAHGLERDSRQRMGEICERTQY
jgi:hypothetical protein